MDPRSLPVYQQKERILEALKEHQVIVVESPTGSGKTTQLPVILDEAGYAKYGLVGVTQPRRIAAISVSEFIARQLGERVPGRVGYKMRFEDKTDQTTRIKIMTDGILLQEMKLDPALSKYSVIMVDEAHERSLNIDFILGLLKRVIESRPEFKVIVSSATINAEVFAEFFGQCPIVKIETPMYPVTVVYDPPPPDYRDEGIQDKIEEIVGRVVGEGREGDVLVFLPGEKAIKDCMKRLAYGPVGHRLMVIPLYARLGKDEQERVFDVMEPGTYKVVVSTNIAETSLTIDGVTTVIDSGLAKLNFYNPKTFTSSLIETPTSKASSNQRKGRAGRTRPGVCYRLFSRAEFEGRPLFTTEEIYRTDLTEVVLRMAELGITEFERFEFISQPPKSGVVGAVDALSLLEALNPDRTLTRVGELMCAFPLLPRHSRIIVEAMLRYPDVVEEALIGASFLSTQGPYVLPPGEEMEARRAHHAFRDPDGDFVSYLKIFRAFTEAKDKSAFCAKSYLDERTMLEIQRVKEQLELIVSGLGMPISRGGPIEDYLCAVSRGLIQFVCVRQERGLFKSLTAEKIQIHPGSVMFRENPLFIVAGEIVRTTRMYAMSVSPLSRDWLARISPRLEGLLSRSQAREMERDERRAAERGYPSGGREERGAAPARGGRREAAPVSLAGEDEGPVRDFTNKIKIGGEIFDIRAEHKKKIVVLDWPSLARAREQVDRDSLALYKGLKGVLHVGHKRLLEGEKLEAILKMSPWLDPERDLQKDWPRKRNYQLPEELSALLAELEHVLQVAEWKPKNPELGFVSLFTDGEGSYWFRVSRGFHTALNESLASLESLVDALGADEARDKLGAGDEERVGALYRKLQGFFE